MKRVIGIRRGAFTKRWIGFWPEPRNIPRWKGSFRLTVAALAREAGQP
ncbi:hypothetical protein [Rhizobium sp. NXC24]|nr:hypothetical protein [Rhizobium sp. NXC24]